MQQDIIEKLAVTQMVVKFSAFYGTRRVITLFIRATGPYPEPE
jgi:hypothetical protein